MAYYLPVMVPDFLLLFGIRAGHGPGVRTLILDNRDIHQHINHETREVLRSKLFTVVPPRGAPNASVPPTKALLYGPKNKPNIALRLNRKDIKPVTPEAAAALEELEVAVKLAAHDTEHAGVTLTNGMLAIMMNKQCIHGRTAMDVRFDGNDRMTMRTYVMRATCCLNCTQSRTFSRVFSA